MSGRRGYALLAVLLFAVEAAIALWVRDRFVRPYLGDTLAVVLVYAALRAATGWRWPFAALAAFAIACAVELGQLIGVLRLLGWQDVAVARVVLGTGFEPLDFVAYAAGAIGIALVEARRSR